VVQRLRLRVHPAAVDPGARRAAQASRRRPPGGHGAAPDQCPRGAGPGTAVFLYNCERESRAGHPPADFHRGGRTMSSRKADEVNLNIDAPGAEELCDNVNLNSRQIANKYEAAIVAAMEARRLNDITRVTGEWLSA